MVIIKINMKIVALSFFIAILMYPRTIEFIITTGKNIYIAKKLSETTVPDNTTITSADKTKIVFMFDDGWNSVYSEAYPLLKQYNYKASVQVIPSLINEQEYMRYSKLAQLSLEGWDLLNHSYSHKENMYDKSDKLFADFNKARKWMHNRYIGTNSDMIVMPYGEINPYLLRKLNDAGYHSVRTSDNIIILGNDIEYYPVTAINLLTDVGVSKVIDLLTSMFNEPKTVLFILHKVGEQDNGFGMTYSKDKLEQIILFIHKHEDQFEVITYSQLFYDQLGKGN